MTSLLPQPDPELIKILDQGVDVWNRWVGLKEGPGDCLYPLKLTGADLRGRDLRRARFRTVDLGNSNLSDAVLDGALLTDTNLSGADLTGASLRAASMVRADLSLARLEGACFQGANLEGAKFFAAHLGRVDFSFSNLSGADLCSTWGMTGMVLRGSRVRGVFASATDEIIGDDRDLHIGRRDDPDVTVDNFEVAQFIQLYLQHRATRGFLLHAGFRAILLVGQFGKMRTEVLDTIRESIRAAGYFAIWVELPKTLNADRAALLTAIGPQCAGTVLDMTNAGSEEAFSLCEAWSNPRIVIRQLGQKHAMDARQVSPVTRDLQTYQDADGVRQLLETAFFPSLAG